MDASVLTAWLAVALMFVLSVVLLSGRGSFLIAGYNTSSQEEKKKYNAKRLCRVTGGCMGIITIIMGISAYYEFEMPAMISWLVPWGIFAMTAVLFVLANTICKNKK